MDRGRTRDDAEGLRLLEMMHGLDEDSVRGEVWPPPPDPALVAELRAAIDRSFELAWQNVRARARAATAKRARPSFASWTREALVYRLERLREALGPQLQLAHRHLADMTDDDLRTLLGDVEELAEQQGARLP